jgi:hypothetical protein
MAYIRGFQTGPHSAASQQILNELATARITLLDPAKKAAYDAQLRAERQRASEVWKAGPPFGFYLRGAARYAAVQSERLWTCWLRLPLARLSLGRAVREQQRYRASLGPLYAELEQLERRRDALAGQPSATADQPPSARPTLAERLKRGGASLLRAVRRLTLNWRYNVLLARLGGEAYAIDNVLSGPADLTAPIKDAQATLERLRLEAERLAVVPPQEWLSPAPQHSYQL